MDIVELELKDGTKKVIGVPPGITKDDIRIIEESGGNIEYEYGEGYDRVNVKLITEANGSETEEKGYYQGNKYIVDRSNSEDASYRTQDRYTVENSDPKSLEDKIATDTVRLYEPEEGKKTTVKAEQDKNQITISTKSKGLFEHEKQEATFKIVKDENNNITYEPEKVVTVDGRGNKTTYELDENGGYIVKKVILPENVPGSNYLNPSVESDGGKIQYVTEHVDQLPPEVVESNNKLLEQHATFQTEVEEIPLNIPSEFDEARDALFATDENGSFLASTLQLLNGLKESDTIPEEAQMTATVDENVVNQIVKRLNDTADEILSATEPLTSSISNIAGCKGSDRVSNPLEGIESIPQEINTKISEQVENVNQMLAIIKEFLDKKIFLPEGYTPPDGDEDYPEKENPNVGDTPTGDETETNTDKDKDKEIDKNKDDDKDSPTGSTPIEQILKPGNDEENKWLIGDNNSRLENLLGEGYAQDELEDDELDDSDSLEQDLIGIYGDDEEIKIPKLATNLAATLKKGEKSLTPLLAGIGGTIITGIALKTAMDKMKKAKAEAVNQENDGIQLDTNNDIEKQEQEENERLFMTKDAIESEL